jgi:S-adenosyl-L-methionine hydrolase (adenosine-forming)
MNVSRSLLVANARDDEQRSTITNNFAMSLLTLTTDFGDSSPYVAVMKGIIHSINPSINIVDLTHHIPPQNIRHGSFFLSTAIPYFPSSTIHVAVVDPGVGTDREMLLAKLEAQYILAPDNGLLSALFDKHPPTQVWKLTETRFWRTPISSTFHGRDILAPVAANLSLQRKPERFGEETKEWVRLPGEPHRSEGVRAAGSIQFVDHFGNLISNIPARVLAQAPTRISLAGQPVEGVRWVRTYAEAAAGELVGLGSSDGFVELAVVEGSAAQRLGVNAGASIDLILPKAI